MPLLFLALSVFLIAVILLVRWISKNIPAKKIKWVIYAWIIGLSGVFIFFAFKIYYLSLEGL